jgi:hypothetical protein
MMVIRLCTCFLLTLATGMAWAAESPAREFTADIVSRDNHGNSAATVARLYAAHYKVRIEPSESPGDFFLIDQQASSTLLVRPGQRLYVNARQSSPLTQVFVPIDISDPCQQWRSAFEDAAAGKGRDHWRCNKLKASEFSIACTEDAVERRLIDPHLRFPLKAVAADGTSLTLENIRETPQQANLFMVPRGYQAFDPMAVVERIKHSDVWAAPPSP